MSALPTTPRKQTGFPFEERFQGETIPWSPADGGPLHGLHSLTSSPAWSEKESSQVDIAKNIDQVADLYLRNREVLTSAIETSANLVNALDSFNKDRWAIRYPQELGVAEQQANVTPKRQPQRSQTQLPSNEKEIPSHPLSILSLDLQMGHSHVAKPRNLADTLAMLGQSTVSQLVSSRLESASNHLEALKTRVQDTSSKVLVTGDLNAGKSTFVNAILQRDLMPVDQQPCTEIFTEIMDAKVHNKGVEEVHAIKDADLPRYRPSDAATFTRYSMADIAQASVDGAEHGFTLVKAYINDARADEDAVQAGIASPSFVRNGLVSISLIDAPGLNRDTLSTTAVFSKQPQIDVVVFVASAENHFTLSAKEFLWNASQEKAYVFVVVNKFANIRDKKRCERLVGDQIRKLSPATYENRAELVHFVDAQTAIDVVAVMLAEEGKTVEPDMAFDNLEKCLRSFVLHKRSKSKLAPAKHYLSNLLFDLDILAQSNIDTAERQLDSALAKLDVVKPIHERLVKEREESIDAITKVEEVNVDLVKDSAWNTLDNALRHVARGEVIPTDDKNLVAYHPKVDVFSSPAALPAYPGVLGIWSWANQVRDTLLHSLEGQVRLAEESARQTTIKGVEEITGSLADRYLPDEERNKPKERVFQPEVMYAKRRATFAKLQQRKGLGSSAVGLNATIASQQISISLLDLMDLERLFPFGKSDKQAAVDEDLEAASALSVVSLGVGALTMFGSRAVGVRSLVETIARACEVLGSPQARKWVGPVVGVCTIGLAVYIVVDLPRAVPRNIGRKLQASLDASTAANGQPQTFAMVQADRISRETRKVLRLAGWDLRERCRSALEKTEQERKEIEASRDQSKEALSWLSTFVDQLTQEGSRVNAINLEDVKSIM